MTTFDETALRKLANDWGWRWCNGSSGRSERDPIYLNELTEGRDQGASQAGYSSCADVIHGIWYRLGIRAPWINRKEFTGWRSGLNVSLLAFTATAWLHGGSNGLYAAPPKPEAQFGAGDCLIVWPHTNGNNAHVMMVLEYDASGKRALVAEAGQPGSAVHNKQFTVAIQPDYRGRMTPCLKLGQREVQRWLPLGDVLAKAAELGLLVDPVAPPVQQAMSSRPVLRQGSDAKAAVVELQTLINRAGIGITLATDGDFGPMTANALKAFQTRARLIPDGICGPSTWRAIDAQ